MRRTFLVLAVLWAVAESAAGDKFGVFYEYSGTRDCGESGTQTEPHRMIVDFKSFQAEYLGRCVGPNFYGAYQIASCEEVSGGDTIARLKLYTDSCCTGEHAYPGPEMSPGCFADGDSFGPDLVALTSLRGVCMDEYPNVDGLATENRFEDSTDCGATVRSGGTASYKNAVEPRYYLSPAVCEWKNDGHEARKHFCLNGNPAVQRQGFAVNDTSCSGTLETESAYTTDCEGRSSWSNLWSCGRITYPNDGFEKGSKFGVDGMTANSSCAGGGSSRPPCDVICLNGGTCDSSRTACTCPSTWTGTRCETPVCDLNCGAHGRCVITTAGAKRCSCSNGYTGDRCQTAQPTCPENHCKNGGRCSVHTDGSFMCRCVDGYSGATCLTAPAAACTLACGSNGVCVTGSGGAQSCECFAGWTGSRCNVAPVACDIACGAGTCVLAYDAAGVARPTCRCPPGFLGASCEIRPRDTCDLECQNGGECVFARVGAENVKQCRCRVGWTGDRCDTSTTAGCTLECGSNGKCVASGSEFTCECRNGYTSSSASSLCDVPPSCTLECGSNAVRCAISSAGNMYCLCLPGVTGDRCEILPPVCDLDCGLNGICQFIRADDGTRASVCRCKNGYSGAACGNPPPRVCGLACVNGACIFDAAGEAQCSCRTGYTGTLCDELAPEPDCPSPCLNGGSCVQIRRRDGTAVPQCQCRGEYSGDDCSVEPPVACDCSGHGECILDFATGDEKCRCEDGYAGASCDFAIECPGQCSNRGRCVENAVGIAVCECIAGFSGEDCSEEEAKECPSSCGANGFCDRTNGLCICDDGWTGEDCTEEAPTPAVACPSDCSGNGVCNSKLGTCKCKEGWTGNACDQDPCTAAGVVSCQRCSSKKACVFCPSSGLCVNAKRFPFEQGKSTECLLDDVITRPNHCPTEGIGLGKSPTTDPVPTKIKEGDADPARFRGTVENGGECVGVTVAEGNPCVSIKKGATPPTRASFDHEDCATDSKRTLEICPNDSSGNGGGRRLLDEASTYQLAVSGPGAVAVFVGPPSNDGATTAAGFDDADGGDSDEGKDKTVAIALGVGIPAFVVAAVVVGVVAVAVRRRHSAPVKSTNLEETEESGNSSDDELDESEDE